MMKVKVTMDKEIWEAIKELDPCDYFSNEACTSDCNNCIASRVYLSVVVDKVEEVEE